MLGIEYSISYTNTWEKPDFHTVMYGGFNIRGYDFTIITLWDKEGNKLINTFLNDSKVTYNDPDGAKALCIKINIESLIKGKILEEDNGIYKILISIIMANNIPYSVSIQEYEITSFGDNERKYISQSPHEVMVQSLITVLGSDLGLGVKLKFDLPITFEDISNVDNIEIRERALRKFGYEDYVKEGFKRNKISNIIIKEDGFIHFLNPIFPLPEKYYTDSNEKLIYFDNNIAFLQVKDSSTGKTYFLKIPPSIIDIQEAKAWTFGLEPKEYNPLVET